MKLVALSCSLTVLYSHYITVCVLTTLLGVTKGYEGDLVTEVFGVSLSWIRNILTGYEVF